MKSTWFETFWNDNGQRLIYMAIAAGLGGAFYMLSPEMAGEGKTILVGVATFALTRMRGGDSTKQ